MNTLKKSLGVVWILLGFVIAYKGGTTYGLDKIHTGKIEDQVFGYVILCVLLPIIVGGLLLFGRYALAGDYADE